MSLRLAGRRAALGLLGCLCVVGCLSLPKDGPYGCDPVTGANCTSTGPPNGQAPSETSDGGGSTETVGVRGSAISHHYTSRGEILHPRDWTSSTLGAFFFDTGTGQYRYYSGTGKPDGTFEIPDVPAGEFIL